MSKTFYYLFLLLAVIVLNACGGVIGNIQKYPFNTVSLDSLKAAVKTVYEQNPGLKDYDTMKYKDSSDGDCYLRIKTKEDDYFFVYAYPRYLEPDSNFSEIALTSAAKYGEVLSLASNISIFKKIKYKRLFETYFIARVREKVKKK